MIALASSTRFLYFTILRAASIRNTVKAIRMRTFATQAINLRSFFEREKEKKKVNDACEGMHFVFSCQGPGG